MDLSNIETLALYRLAKMEQDAVVERKQKEIEKHLAEGTREVQSPRLKRQLGLTLIRAGEWLVRTT